MNFENFKRYCARRRGLNCQVLLNDDDGGPTACCWENCPLYERLKEETREEKDEANDD